MYPRSSLQRWTQKLIYVKNEGMRAYSYDLRQRILDSLLIAVQQKLEFYEQYQSDPSMNKQ
jgi:hypothetical protein